MVRIKGWKKGKVSSFKEYYKSTLNHSFLVIQKSFGIWNVVLVDNYKILGVFSTKSQALKFAKQYMRTH